VEKYVARPTKSQALIRAAREGQPVQRVEIPRTTCPRCHTEQYALPDSRPRPHLRPAVHGDPEYREDIPIMTSCEEQA
jgi:hypothetical protein